MLRLGAAVAGLGYLVAALAPLAPALAAWAGERLLGQSWLGAGLRAWCSPESGPATGPAVGPADASNGGSSLPAAVILAARMLPGLCKCQMPCSLVR